MIISVDRATRLTLWAQRDTPGLVEVLTLLKRKSEALIVSARDTMPAGPDRDGRISESRALAEMEREIRQLIKDEQNRKEVESEQPPGGASVY